MNLLTNFWTSFHRIKQSVLTFAVHLFLSNVHVILGFFERGQPQLRAPSSSVVSGGAFFKNLQFLEVLLLRSWVPSQGRSTAKSRSILRPRVGVGGNLILVLLIDHSPLFTYSYPRSWAKAGLWSCYVQLSSQTNHI